ncbi:MAG: hypothetical protein ACTSSG_11370 [Candidatus Heimdallarchaeaceae archaeon]
MDQINDSLLKASVETRLVKAYQFMQMLPNVTQEFLEREQRIKKDIEQLKKEREKFIQNIKFFLKYGEEIKNNRRVFQSEARAFIKHLIEEIKELTKDFSDPMFKKQFKEWEKKITIKADRFFDTWQELPMDIEMENKIKEMLKQ